MPRRLFPLFLWLAAGLCLVLAFLSRPGDGLTGFEQDAFRTEEKIRLLEDAGRRGVHGFQTFYEYEVNAFLALLLDRQEKLYGDRPPMRQLESVNLNFTSNRVTVVISARWGPVPAQVRFSGPWGLENGLLLPEIDRVWLGRLPVPPGLAGPTVRRAAGVFRSMERERDLLHRVLRFSTGEDWVRIGVSPPVESGLGPEKLEESR